MASSSLVNAKKSLKKMESRKSHSWWWDSHIGPKNSKWLADNLEEMDRNVKSMLRLIEEEGDSFAKKVEIYYQKRPQLISHVEEFYRMYRSLAERYDHLTGELRKDTDLQSQGSVGSEAGSEPIFAGLTPTPDSKISRRQSGQRAAGFDFFLGSGRSSTDQYSRGDDSSLLSDTESESDVSSIHSYPGIPRNFVEEGMQGNGNGSLRTIRSENLEELNSEAGDYDEELKTANEKIRLLEEEIAELKAKLQNSASLDSNSQHDVASATIELDPDENLVSEETEVSDPVEKIRVLVEELRITKGRLLALDREVIQMRKENKESSESIRQLQEQLKMAQKDASMWKLKLETEKRHASKMQERITRYKSSLSDRENEVRDLKEVISDATRKYQLHDEISRLSEEKTRLEEKLREREVQCQTLEIQQGILDKRLNEEIEQLKTDIAEKTNQLETVNSDFDMFKVRYDTVVAEKDELNAKVPTLTDEVSARNNQIDQMEKQAKEAVEQLKMKVEELKREVENQKILIKESGEEKREAIRQLCFSLEHYRLGYHQLRKAFTGHKRHPIFAS